MRRPTRSATYPLNCEEPEKLTERETTTDLSRLHDIGGCRVIVGDIATVRKLEDRIRDDPRNKLVKARDYIETPRYSGYRAVHLVVSRNDSLPIEIQLRSQMMHRWAETAEGFSKELGINLKQDGDHIVQRFLAVASEIYRCLEVGSRIEPSVRDRYNQLLPEVRAILDERSQQPLF
ncbi:RelA/SpoT domain-containing protein [Rothia koreensis]|uniref:RelA/SpoT domain-containing protein n=1 Tax=Rothia koreensis TaxID=592378 RepID=UPI003FCE8D48